MLDDGSLGIDGRGLEGGDGVRLRWKLGRRRNVRSSDILYGASSNAAHGKPTNTRARPTLDGSLSSEERSSDASKPERRERKRDEGL